MYCIGRRRHRTTSALARLVVVALTVSSALQADVVCFYILHVVPCTSLYRLPTDLLSASIHTLPDRSTRNRNNSTGLIGKAQVDTPRSWASLSLWTSLQGQNNALGHTYEHRTNHDLLTKLYIGDWGHRKCHKRSLSYGPTHSLPLSM